MPVGEPTLTRTLGIRTRDARDLCRLAKRQGWEMTLQRATALAAMPSTDWETAGLEFIPPPPTPKEPTPPRESEGKLKGKGTAKAGKKEEVKRRPSKVKEEDFDPESYEGRSLADEIRVVAKEVRRLHALYEAERLATDSDDEDGQWWVEKRRADWTEMLKVQGEAMKQLRASEGLGDTRSLSTIVTSLAEAASLIRSDINSIPDRLAADMAASGGDAAKASGACRHMARALVERTLNSLERRFRQILETDHV